MSKQTMLTWKKHVFIFKRNDGIRNAGFELLPHPSSIVFMRHCFKWLLFISQTEETPERTQICTRRWHYLHGKWLAEKKDQQFFYNIIRALEICRTKCISVAEDYIKKLQDIMHISCD